MTREQRNYPDDDPSLGGPSPAFFPVGAKLYAQVEAGTFNRESKEGAALMAAAGLERGEKFAHATQGRGKPMGYGHGSRERYLKETKG